ncbi:MAG: AAA family ATPase [Candidatus Heimdallarchaeota archaeon]
MKINRAEFINFRLLKDLEITFSTEKEKNLTVIRAANETGKTTILTALQWALYGDSSLPGKSSDFRLHPIDWDITANKRVPICVTVEFEVKKWRQGKTRNIEKIIRYRLVRTATEELNGNRFNRSPSSVNLYRLTDRGQEIIEYPEAIVNEVLPQELREVFFTDGDRALSFIEADVAVATKRDRVKKAIRSLLGLEIIEDTVRHVKKTSSAINKKAKSIGGGEDLNETANSIEEIDTEIEALLKGVEDSKQQFCEFDEKVKEIDNKISAALIKGDKQKLKNDLENTRRQVATLNNRIKAAQKEHSKLFRFQNLSIDLLENSFENSQKLLGNMQKEGKIPNTTIPILEDRLKKQICICGEMLDENDTNSIRRRNTIIKLIDDSQKSDEIQKIVTDLYFSTKNLFKKDVLEGNRWSDSYRKVLENRDSLDDLRDSAGKKLKALEAQIDLLPDTDIIGLKEVKRKYISQRDRFLQQQTQFETRLISEKENRERLVTKRDKLLKNRDQGKQIISELLVTNDIISILEGSYSQITNDEVKKVSEKMNEIFLEMIGSDPNQGAIIRRAKISNDFDIIVYGPKKRLLNPDRDLNGASRRALTLSFILALTLVSEVEAPNVIDTPLGMMSGYVKRSVLKAAIEKSSQLVLFLTHDEIKGCEEILDDAAGVVCTLTNPTHYPKMLKNNPAVSECNILTCDCDHRGECKLCERLMDATTGEGVNA